MVDGLNPRELDRVALLIERISGRIDSIARGFGVVTDEATETSKVIEDSLKKTQKGVYDVKYEVDKLFQDIEQRALPRTEFGLLGPFLGADKFDRLLETLDAKMKRWANEARRHMEARGPFSSLAKGSGLSSVGGGLSALKGQMFAGMPFGMGGLLGMALWGAAREEYFNASARRALYQIQAVGGGAREQIGQLHAKSRSFYQAFGEEGLQIIQQTTAAFAEMNIGTEQFEKASVAAKGFGDDIAGVATAIDLMMAAQPGTTGKLIGETVQSAGVSVKEASDHVFTMARRLRELGLNYAQFSQGIVSSNSALRMQNQSLTDTTRIFDKLYSQLKERGLTKQQAGAIAMERLTAGAGSISGLNMGLQGLIAQGLAKGGMQGFTGMKDPVALMTRFRLGLAETGGGDRDFMSSVFKDLQQRAMQMAGTGGEPEERRLRAIYALSQVGGMSEQAAAAIVDTGKATTELLSPAEKTAKWTDELNTSFSTYQRNQDRFTVDMRIMQDTLAQIGGDILSVLTASFMILINEVQNFGLRLKDLSPTFFGKLSTSERQRLNALDRYQTGLGGVQNAAFQSTVGHLGTIAKLVAKEGERTTTGRLAGRFGTLQTLRDTYNRAVQTDEDRPEASWEVEAPSTPGTSGTRRKVSATVGRLQGNINRKKQEAHRKKMAAQARGTGEQLIKLGEVMEEDVGTSPIAPAATASTSPRGRGPT